MSKNNDAKPEVTLNYPGELVPPPEPPYGSRLEHNVYVAMRDGVRIAVDIYLPEEEGTYPALLSLSPYMQDIQRKPPHWSHAIESGATSFYVPKGYVHVIAQGRGGGRSQGQWRWLDQKEGTDGYDLIEWIAAQPWCTGSVGMIGDSYWSWSQYAAAIAQPPHLKCICPCDGTTDIYRDVCYQGGLYNHQFLGNWTEYVAAQTAWPGPVEGKLPPMNLQYELMARPYDGPWYRERSAWPKLDHINTPVMAICPQGGHMHFRGQLWGFPLITAPKKLMVVPPTGFWSHMHYLTNRALNRQMLRWYDYWLKGIDTGIMDEPMVAIFDSATRQWRYEDEYPIGRTEWTKLYLSAGSGGTAKEPPYGCLDTEPPGNEKPDSYRMPDSYDRLVEGKPVLAYLTAPLDKDLRIWGPLSFNLFGASSRIDTAWHVKVAEITTDGRVVPLTRGVLKASFREIDETLSTIGQPFHPFERQDLLEPGKIYEFQIELRPVFRTIRAGDQIRVEIASEDIQYSNPIRQVDVQLLPWPVENTVFHDAEHPSHLLLPAIPDAPEKRPVESPLADIEWPLLPGAWLPNTDGWPLTDD
ncbi:CocE/NonD family hydrolase [Thermodesulfobacteriota bacterium]